MKKNFHIEIDSMKSLLNAVYRYKTASFFLFITFLRKIVMLSGKYDDNLLAILTFFEEI